MSREQYLDGKNVALADVRRLHLLPEEVRTWPPVKRVRLNGLEHWKLFDEFHSTFNHCWLCGAARHEHLASGILQAHHLFPGARKSDERCCLAMLCLVCHRDRVSREWLARLLWAKWFHDRDGTDWKRMTWLAARWLPEPEPFEIGTSHQRRTA